MTAPAILTISADQNLGLPIVAVHLFVFYYGIVSDDTPPGGPMRICGGGYSRIGPHKNRLEKLPAGSGRLHPALHVHT